MMTTAMKGLLLVLVLAPAFAYAADARKLYEGGIAHYKLGELDAAIADFTAAYELDPSPTLLFNIAQAHRRNGDTQQALLYYRAFVANAPPSQARSDAEQILAQLEPAAVSVAPPSSSRPLPERRNAIALVASTAAIGTALPLVGAGLSIHASDEAPRFDTSSDKNGAAAMYVLGGTALAASIVSAILCRHSFVRETQLRASR